MRLAPDSRGTPAPTWPELPVTVGNFGPRRRNVRNRGLFVTTNTDEKAIVAPAITGFGGPAAAGGSAATL